MCVCVWTFLNEWVEVVERWETSRNRLCRLKRYTSSFPLGKYMMAGTPLTHTHRTRTPCCSHCVPGLNNKREWKEIERPKKSEGKFRAHLCRYEDLVWRTEETMATTPPQVKAYGVTMEPNANCARTAVIGALFSIDSTQFPFGFAPNFSQWHNTIGRHLGAVHKFAKVQFGNSISKSKRAKTAFKVQMVEDHHHHHWCHTPAKVIEHLWSLG